jgi:hypothetical protein
MASTQPVTRQAELQHVIIVVLKDEEYVRESLTGLKVNTVAGIINLKRQSLENGTYDDNGVNKPIPESTMDVIWAFKHYVQYRDSLSDPDHRINNNFIKTNYDDFMWYCSTLHDFDTGDAMPLDLAYFREKSEKAYKTKLRQTNAATGPTAATTAPTSRSKNTIIHITGKSAAPDTKRSTATTASTIVGEPNDNKAYYTTVIDKKVTSLPQCDDNKAIDKKVTSSRV